jgi:hypothetical protein
MIFEAPSLDLQTLGDRKGNWQLLSSSDPLSEPELADALRRLIAAGIPLDSASDHGGSAASSNY